jgi:hypothetical protein
VAAGALGFWAAGELGFWAVAAGGLDVWAAAKVDRPDVSPIAAAVMTVAESHPDMSRRPFMVFSSWNWIC